MVMERPSSSGSSMSGMVRDVEPAVTDMKTSCDPPVEESIVGSCPCPICSLLWCMCAGRSRMTRDAWQSERRHDIATANGSTTVTNGPAPGPKVCRSGCSSDLVTKSSAPGAPRQFARSASSSHCDTMTIRASASGLSDLPGRGQAVHRGHLQVHQHHIRLVLQVRGQRLAAVRTLDHLKDKNQRRRS